MERAKSGIFSCLCDLWGAMGIAPDSRELVVSVFKSFLFNIIEPYSG